MRLIDYIIAEVVLSLQASTGKAAELILNAVKLQIAHAPATPAPEAGRAFATALQLAELSSQVCSTRAAPTACQGAVCRDYCSS